MFIIISNGHLGSNHLDNFKIKHILFEGLCQEGLKKNDIYCFSCLNLNTVLHALNKSSKIIIKLSCYLLNDVTNICRKTNVYIKIYSSVLRRNESK